MREGAHIRVGVGTRVIHEGQLLKVVEVHAGGPAGAEVVLCSNGAEPQYLRMSIGALLADGRYRLVPDTSGPSTADPVDPASSILSALTEQERNAVAARAEHIREVLTGFCSGSEELARVGEPRAEYHPTLPKVQRYQSKAQELGVSLRTIKQWVADYRAYGEAGLAQGVIPRQKPFGLTDERWLTTAIEVMVEHRDQSRPTRKFVIQRTNARVVARHGEGVVPMPAEATAYRVLRELDKKIPVFTHSTKRNREIAERPEGVYGKLTPTRPGEYVLLDSTPLDVFAYDPVTLQWVNVELTVAMDWYTRCIVGVRLTPRSTKSVDAAYVLYQTYRPRPAGEHWPAHAVWPEHGIPRSILIDVDAWDAESVKAGGPSIVPETVIIDHGRIFISMHFTSVCQRMGISIQPARLRTGRDKGPLERFFLTLRLDFLQALEGYKGPDIYSRGADPEAEAFFFIDELEAMIREWVATLYHNRPHDSLFDPRIPGLNLSPAEMFEYGVAGAGYIEAPRDPDLAYEFLPTVWRKIEPYGVDINKRRYNGAALNGKRLTKSPYGGKANGRWPFQYNPDDITRVYFRDPETFEWHTLKWEHAGSLNSPISEDQLTFARKRAAANYRYFDDKLALAELLERLHLSMGATRAERRMALRLSREDALLNSADPASETTVSSLPSVQKVLDQAQPCEEGEDRNLDELSGTTDPPHPESGDDEDDDHDVDIIEVTEFYADSFEDA